jgi:osmotically-inducible protein OsmY
MQTRPFADCEIARNIMFALTSDSNLPGDRIHVTVNEGHASLDGEVDWNFQSIAAGARVFRIPGVLDVANHLVVHPLSGARQNRERTDKCQSC